MMTTIPTRELTDARPRAVLVHPIVGMLLVDEATAHDVAGDIGKAYDLNDIGTLKSRVTLCW